MRLQLFYYLARMAGIMVRSIALLGVLVIQSIDSSVGIVGGEYAEENSYPYQASIRVHGDHKCGGSLLNHRWLLSSAHCLVDHTLFSLIIVLGSNNLIHGGIAYNVTERLLHPNFERGQHHDDIALLRLGQWVNYTKAIAPVKLPSQTFYTKFHSKQLAIFTGWGSSQIGASYSLRLKFIELPIINIDQCRKIFPSINLTNICTLAGSQRGLCYGDGGSPLVDTDQIIIGIGSWGSPCARGYPDVHIRIRSYIGWIKTTVADDAEN